MKSKVLLFVSSVLLISCHLQPVVTPLSAAPKQFTTTSTAPKSLSLSPSLKAELNLSDEEAEPRNNDFSETLVKGIIGPDHIKAHSYFFTFMDQGKSSVSQILAHDGHPKSAELVHHWRALLGENARWPDNESTSYKGPWPALEHGEYNSRGDGWFWFKSGSTKAEEYYQRAFQAWKPGLPADHPDQAEAWSWLSRTSHFIQDITVPFHTMSLARPAQWFHHNPYEHAAEDHFHKYLPTQNYNPFGVWKDGPYPAAGTWGIYFPKRTSAGDMLRFGAAQSRPFYSLVNEKENPQKGNWEKTRAVLMPMGAKLTAGLVHAFLSDVGAGD